ncbi:glycoside hydrolase family 3 protein [Oenococcus sp. UCMA 17063]|nr:glycoside hydrolase family 3 protein [Oenococcus sp. UCMA 17063]
MNINLSDKPFNLNQTQIEWVKKTFSSMTLEEKIGQLFCTSISDFTSEIVNHLTKDIKVGGLMIRPFPVKNLQKNLRNLQNASRLPLLISANLESGGNGAIEEGTIFNMPEGCSATGDIENGYRLGKISCQEAASVGVNWGYAPIVDIDLNYRNPITNIRTFGNNRDMVIKMARGYIKAAKEEGIAPTIKHFPGDGVDERDQHLLVSVNSLSYDEWIQSYGHIYKTLIKEGAPVVMAAHIAQPAVAREIDPSISDYDAFLPASLSKTLTTGFLRNNINFNGLIVTDSTLMMGFMEKMPRRQAVPQAIESGCDVLLFNRNIDEDFAYMTEGYQKGILSDKRLNEAVLRILGLKASMNLHIKHQNGKIVPDVDPMSIINSPLTKKWVEECADKAVTLVKDNRDLLPLSPKKTKRIYLNVIENYVSNDSKFAENIKNRLEKEGFVVELRKRELDFNPNLLLEGIITPSIANVMKEVQATTEDFVSKYDLCLIVVNMETVSNSTVIRINWKVMMGLGNDLPWYSGEIPLVVISTANPYHLLDIPMAHAYINTYTNNKETLDAVFNKLAGRSKFKGISPVDPFCGHEDCGL